MESFVLGMNEYFCNTEEKENKQALSLVYNSVYFYTHQEMVSIIHKFQGSNISVWNSQFRHTGLTV